MKFNVDKIIYNFECIEELGEIKYFTQFNIYENVKLNNKKICITNIKATNPNLNIYTTKIINTIKGVSLEGQNSTGKKLIITGSADTSIVVKYANRYKSTTSLEKQHIMNINIPFSTFIIIPNNICKDDEINLRYHIEDITAEIIGNDNIFVSVTLLIQYSDEY